MKDNSLKPIVHVATDVKFIDAAYEMYEKAFPGKNYFSIILSNKKKQIQYLSRCNSYNYYYTNSNFLPALNEKLMTADVIVFHGLDYEQAKILNEFDKNKAKIIWNSYGFEVYNNYRIYGKYLYGSMTYRKFIFKPSLWLKRKLRTSYIKHKYLKTKESAEEVIIDNLKKIDYVGILFKEEFDKYNQLGVLSDNAMFLKFTYYPLDIIINKSSNYSIGKNILVGNSATLSNNHLEAFEIIERYDITERKIIVPLSYGDEFYKKEILKIGKEKFQKNFLPLNDFLPLPEYQEILQSCGIVIMNQYRQQAVGNVLNAMYLGAKVYLSNRNTLYHYLKRIGCHIFNIEKDLVSVNHTAFELLNEKQIIENREILKQELSVERVVNELKLKLTPLLN